MDGEETRGLSDRGRARVMRKFGMLFQGGALFDSLRVWENVAFGPMQSDGMAAEQAREVAVAKLGAVGLGPEIGELFPSELSGGMQKRVALARAIAREPEIIFFDEPTTGLDPIMADVINDLIVKCVSDLGATAISITHDMASARKIGHRIGMLHEGRLIWQGPRRGRRPLRQRLCRPVHPWPGGGPDPDAGPGNSDRGAAAQALRLPVLRRRHDQVERPLRILRRVEHHRRGGRPRARPGRRRDGATRQGSTARLHGPHRLNPRSRRASRAASANSIASAAAGWSSAPRC